METFRDRSLNIIEFTTSQFCHRFRIENQKPNSILFAVSPKHRRNNNTVAFWFHFRRCDEDRFTWITVKLWPRQLCLFSDVNFYEKSCIFHFNCCAYGVEKLIIFTETLSVVDSWKFTANGAKNFGLTENWSIRFQERNSGCAIKGYDIF